MQNDTGAYGMCECLRDRLEVPGGLIRLRLWGPGAASRPIELGGAHSMSIGEVLEALQSIADGITIILVAAGTVIVFVIIFRKLFLGAKAMFRAKRP